jgi:hypothetical protein
MFVTTPSWGGCSSECGPWRSKKKSDKFDLCFVEPMPGLKGGLVLAARAPLRFDGAYTLGHPGNEPLQYYDGFATGQMEADEAGNLADAYSFPAAGGQSGSPVFDESGRIVGVVAWRFLLTGQAMAVRWDQLKLFIWSDVKSSSSRRAPNRGPSAGMKSR